jgi:hypothetical protein
VKLAYQVLVGETDIGLNVIGPMSLEYAYPLHIFHYDVWEEFAVLYFPPKVNTAII